MKKIGIMTMQRIRNYGSFLQAYGLKKIIESLGYNVEFIDYKYDKSLVNSNTPILKKIVSHINVFKYFERKKVLNEYIYKFDNKFIPELCGTDKNYNKNIDSLVIGSDEVFNFMQGYPVGYSKNLFGYGYEDKNVISYAASFGQTSYKDIKEQNIEHELSKMLNKFKIISVRDSNSFEIVEKLTGKKPVLNLDPVLVSNFENEIIDNVNISDYIILYAYPDRISKEEGKQIKEFAKKHNKKIVSFGMYQSISDIELVVHPFEILSYFKHADFVITDTFHGSIFSIINHTKFCTIIRNNKKGNSNKLKDLLLKLKLENRILSDISKLEEKYEEKISFKMTDKIIEEEKKKTKEYFINNL